MKSQNVENKVSLRQSSARSAPRQTAHLMSRKYELHPTQINTWKREAVANMASVFNGEKADVITDIEQQTEKLYAQIGQLKVIFLKKIIVKPLSERRAMVDNEESSLSITQQCRILSIHRSGLYYKPCSESEENLTILRQLYQKG